MCALHFFYIATQHLVVCMCITINGVCRAHNDKRKRMKEEN